MFLAFPRKTMKDVCAFFGLKVNRPGSMYFYLRRMFRRVTDAEGDIVECGVGHMGTFQILAELLREERSERKLWGFDSFEGFPEPHPEDASPRNAQKGQLKDIDAEDVAKYLHMRDFRTKWIEKHIRVERGFFKDTLPTSDVSKIALLHLDVDLYDSYRVCLQYLFPKVTKGGVVLFDEYMNKNESTRFPGAKKAIDEYFSGTGYTLSRDASTGKYFLVK